MYIWNFMTTWKLSPKIRLSSFLPALHETPGREQRDYQKTQRQREARARLFHSIRMPFGSFTLIRTRTRRTHFHKPRGRKFTVTEAHSMLHAGSVQFSHASLP